MPASVEHVRPPFRPLHRLFVRHQGDDAEYLEKMRRSIGWWDRWRWLAVAVHVTIIILVVWGSFHIVESIRFLNGLAPQGAMPETVVLLGVVLGLKLGIVLEHSIGSLLMGIGGLRAERLAIAYHDAIEQHCRRQGNGEPEHPL
jgi:hypothetical protein